MAAGHRAQQVANAEATAGALVVKERRGPQQTGSVGDWWVIRRLSWEVQQWRS